MKVNIHPKWYPEAQVICACGNTFKTGATIPQIKVDVCSECHPFYTGQMKYVDTAGRVESYKTKQSKAKSNLISKSQKRQIKREKKIQKELEKPDTLTEIRNQSKSKKK